MTGKRFSCKRGDLTIRGVSYGLSDEPRPAIIISHGFLADYRTTRPYARYIAGLGYAAFVFDFCGGGIRSRSDGKSEDMTVFTEKQDLLAVLDYVRSLPGVDTSRISLMGCSQGGVVSALTAKERKDEIEKLILFYPAFCIPDDARKGDMLVYKFDPDIVPDLIGMFPMKLGGNYARTVMDLDMFEEIKGYEGPVLLLHGTEDEIVDVSYSRKAKDCYPRCDYRELTGAGHGFRGKSEKEARKALAEFL